MARLWKNNPETPGGKYLVVRRDGTVPRWPHFVLGAKDPATPAALRAYSSSALAHGMDPEFCKDVLSLANEFDLYREQHGDGDPDAPRHRVDDPLTVLRMGEAIDLKPDLKFASGLFTAREGFTAAVSPPRIDFELDGYSTGTKLTIDPRAIISVVQPKVNPGETATATIETGNGYFTVKAEGRDVAAEVWLAKGYVVI